MAEPNVNSLQALSLAEANDENMAPASHPRATEIVRQVEFYFGDENLRQDAHLLGLFKEGKGWVSLNEICGFKKMRQFKPKTAVREALRHSRLVEVSQDGKRLRRKYPLDTKKITVIPKINRDRKKLVVPEDKPWLTKGMLKPTGFESNVTDGPIKPEEYEADKKDYDPEYSFTSRIETAVTRFCARRKMHQNTQKVFAKFMIFGGMEGGQRQFTGGLDEKTMEDYTKKEIAELTSYYGVSEQVMDGLNNEYSEKEATWIVDFEGVAKAFFSSEFLNYFDWYDEDQVKTATNVLRNFYNYLLLHDVCPEYKKDLLAARKVCDEAENELLKLREVDRHLPGGFNVACSTIFNGNYADIHASKTDWAVEGDDLGWSKKDAELIFLTGLFAHGTEEQFAKLKEADKTLPALNIISTEDLGIEITAIELADGEAMNIYSAPQFRSTIIPIRAMGKLHCKRWSVPHAAPVDIPKHLKDQQHQQETETFTFLVEDAILKSCVSGMKLECCVKELDLGVKWIDYVETVYPSFYTWLPNESIREWKEPGPPKAWMVRKMGEERDDADGNGTEGEKKEESNEAEDSDGDSDVTVRKDGD